MGTCKDDRPPHHKSRVFIKGKSIYTFDHQQQMVAFFLTVRYSLIFSICYFGSIKIMFRKLLFDKEMDDDGNC